MAVNVCLTRSRRSPLNEFRKPNVLFPQIIGPSAVRALDHSRVAEPEGLFLSRCGYCNLDR